MSRWIHGQLLVAISLLVSLIFISCKSSKKNSNLTKIDKELGATDDQCFAKLHIVEKLPTINPQNLKPPRITVESIPILKANGEHTGNTEAKIIVSYEQSDPNGYDKPDVIYYRFCQKNSVSLAECKNAARGQSLVLDDRKDGIISNYRNFTFNPGLPEKQVFAVYAWSCVWQGRANNLNDGVVLKYPTQFGNRMLVCQQEKGEAASPYYQDKNADQNLRSLMVDNFDNEAGMKGLAYLSLNRFERYLDETKSFELSREELKIAQQLENNLALGEHYGLFLTSDFEDISNEILDKSSLVQPVLTQKGLSLVENQEDCIGEESNEFIAPPVQPEVVSQPAGELPRVPSGETGVVEYRDDDIGKQEIVDCERRGPEFEFKEGKCWHNNEGEPVNPKLAEELETPPEKPSSSAESKNIGAKIGAWTLIFAGTVAGLTSAIGFSQGIKASRVSSASLVDPFFREPPSMAGLDLEANGLGKPQSVSVPTSVSSKGFKQRYSELLGHLKSGVEQLGVSSLKRLGAPTSLGTGPKLPVEQDAKALNAAGKKLIWGSVSVGLLGVAMAAIGAVTSTSLHLESTSVGEGKARLEGLNEDLVLFFQNFSSFRKKYNENSENINEILK